MDITQFVSAQREKSLTLGSYDSYHAHLTTRIATLRKRLGRATPKNSKFAAKAPITAADVKQNNEYLLGKFRGYLLSLMHDSGTSICLYSRPNERGPRASSFAACG